MSIHIYLAHHDAFYVARHDRAFEPPGLRQPGVNRDICRQCCTSVVATRTFQYQPPAIEQGSRLSTKPPVADGMPLETRLLPSFAIRLVWTVCTTLTISTRTTIQYSQYRLPDVQVASYFRWIFRRSCKAAIYSTKSTYLL